MTHWRICWIAGMLWMAALSALGCRSAGDVPTPPAGDSTRVIHLVEHGWHAGIAIRRTDLPPDSWRVLDDFPEAAYLEVGWGDAAYYPAPNPGVGTLLKAGLWPTASVLHIAALRRPPLDVFARRTIIRIPVSEDGLDALLAFIRREHARREDGTLVPLGPGLYARSRFYQGTTRYHALNNCNTWVARALQTVGCRMAPARALTTRALLAQARDCGTVLQTRE